MRNRIIATNQRPPSALRRHRRSGSGVSFTVQKQHWHFPLGAKYGAPAPGHMLEHLVTGILNKYIIDAGADLVVSPSSIYHDMRLKADLLIKPAGINATSVGIQLVSGDYSRKNEKRAELQSLCAEVLAENRVAAIKVVALPMQTGRLYRKWNPTQSSSGRDHLLPPENITSILLECLEAVSFADPTIEAEVKKVLAYLRANTPPQTTEQPIDIERDNRAAERRRKMGGESRK